MTGKIGHKRRKFFRQVQTQQTRRCVSRYEDTNNYCNNPPVMRFEQFGSSRAGQSFRNGSAESVVRGNDGHTGPLHERAGFGV